MNSYNNFQSENIEIPDNIDDYIEIGAVKGAKAMKKSYRKKLVISALSVFLSCFIVSINVSPTFADLVVQIPGMSYIVDFVKWDKGVQLAFENDYYQTVELSDNHDDITLTVKSVVIDIDQLKIYYSIETEGNYKYIALRDVSLTDEEDKHYSSSYGSYGDFEDKNIEYGEVTFYKNDIPFPDTIDFKASLATSTININSINHSEPTILEDRFEITFDIDKEKFSMLEQEIILNQTVEVENQNLIFESLTIYPLRSALKINFDPNNTKKLLSFEDLYIEDDKGVFSSIANGITASHIDENGIVLYFQSNYFNSSESIVIKGGKFSALDKGTDYIIFDPVEKEILYRPNDKVEFLEYQNGYYDSYDGSAREAMYEFTVKYNDTGEEIGHMHGLFGSIFVDDVKYYSSGSSSSDRGDGFVYHGIQINEDDSIPLDKPWKIMLNYFPEYIEGNFEIKVK